MSLQCLIALGHSLLTPSVPRAACPACLGQDPVQQAQQSPGLAAPSALTPLLLGLDWAPRSLGSSPPPRPAPTVVPGHNSFLSGSSAQPGSHPPQLPFVRLSS